MDSTVHLNLTGIQSGFEAIPDGYYHVVVQEAAHTTSREGNEMLALRFAVQAPEDHAGRLLFANFSLLPQALWKVKQLLEALDPYGDYSGPVQFDVVDLLNLECVAVVTTEMYQGEKRNRVARVMPLDVEVEAEFEGELALAL